MKRLNYILSFVGALALCLLPVALVFGADPSPTPGLDYIAKANAGTNSAAYLASLHATLEANGRQQIESALYDAGNARSRTLSAAHPRTRAAILYLLQLDGWIPDGSGTPPPPFDPAIADSRIENLGSAIPRQ